MKPWLMAMIGRQRRLVTETFTSSATWIVPATTNKIETLSGRGAPGTPAVIIPNSYDIRIEYRRYQNNVLVESTQKFSFTTSASFPTDYCDYSQDSSGGREETCFYYSQAATPQTTGASATAFDKVLPGGIGGPAPVTTFANVAVEPGKPKDFVIPAGGTFTFSYFK